MQSTDYIITISRFQWTQTDLTRELGAVLSACKKIQTNPHLPYFLIGIIILAVINVSVLKAFR